MAKKKEEETKVEQLTPEISPENSETTKEVNEKPKKTSLEAFCSVCKWFFLSYIWLFLIMFILDIVTKNVILSSYAHSESGTYPITMIPNFLYVDFTINKGMAFGIDTGNELANFIVFVSISLIGMLIILLVYGLEYKKLTPFVKACLMLLLAGCIGNLIDRSFYTESYYLSAGLPENFALYTGSSRGVIDWISFKFGNWYFPTFNLADASLVVGAIMLIVWLFVAEGKEDKKKKQELEEFKAQEEAEALKEIETNENNGQASETVVDSESKEAPPTEKSPTDLESQQNGEDSNT